MVLPVCTVCFENFDSNLKLPLILQCGHSLCNVCYDNLNYRSTGCPTCREIPSQDFASKKRRNYTLIEFIQSNQLNNNQEVNSLKNQLESEKKNSSDKETFIAELMEQLSIGNETMREMRAKINRLENYELITEEKKLNCKGCNKTILINKLSICECVSVNIKSCSTFKNAALCERCFPRRDCLKTKGNHTVSSTQMLIDRIRVVSFFEPLLDERFRNPFGNIWKPPQECIRRVGQLMNRLLKKLRGDFQKANAIQKSIEKLGPVAIMALDFMKSFDTQIEEMCSIRYKKLAHMIVDFEIDV